ncbi:carboxypeptidase regulatory-like domain-containing protein [Stieleria marina]|uniref:carboxypeptidase regulatory-like domain-containing protein n=1 Tax=Stieleria marina TaxID=1930275 RepID=UPI003AF3B1DA
MESSGLTEEFFADEEKLRAGYVRLFDNQVFVWKSDDKPGVGFRDAFRRWGKDGEHMVAYAYTEFISPMQQQLLLGLAHDDEVRGWLNGEEVCRSEDRGNATTDSLLKRVTVQKGLNTLLLRVGQGTHSWEVAARFRPVDVADPLLSFRCLPNNNSDRFPKFTVTLLDQRDRVLATHHCGGYREGTADDKRGVYSLFATLPESAQASIRANGTRGEREPAKVRLTANPVGMKPIDETYDWVDIHHRRPIVHLQASSPFRLRLIDNATGKAIPNARAFVEDDGMSVNKADDTGHLSVDGVSPMQWRMFAVAEGFAAKVVYAVFPFGNLHTVKLNRGGKVLRGTVVDKAGLPLPGAKVDVGHTGGYRPIVMTDSQGRFEIVSLNQSLQTLRPMVSCDGYVTQQGFQQSLDPDGPTDVRWTLQTAAEIAGTIVDAATNKPIAGAMVVAGTSRFTSNVPETTSDLTGRFKLQNLAHGTVVLHAISDRHAPQLQIVSVKQGVAATADFELSTGKHVTGVVTDEDGDPVADAHLVCDTWNSHRMFARDTYTNSRGEFTLQNMPDTPTEVHVLKREFISQRNLMVTGGDRVEVELRPVLTHRISVRVAETGDRVPGLTINRGYLWQQGARPSWQSGRYEAERYFDKLSGVMTIPGDENTTYTSLWRFRAPGFQDAIAKIPAQCREAISIDIEMQKASTFTAVVVDDQTKKPLSNVAVALFSGEDPLRSNYVDYRSLWTCIQDGNFTGTFAISNAQGQVILSVPAKPEETAIALVSKDGASPIGRYSRVASEMTTTAAGSEKLITLAFPRPCRLKGRVMQAGSPMSNAKVQLRKLGESANDDAASGHRDSYSIGYGVSGQLATNSKGEFDFGGVGAGRYQLSRSFRYQFPGTQMSRSVSLNSQTVVLEPGQTFTHEMMLPAGQSVKGVVANEAGKPIADCLIQLSIDGETDSYDATTSDAAGEFEFVHIPSGHYRLKSEHFDASERYTGRPTLTAVEDVKVEADDVSVTVSMRNVDQKPAATGLLQKFFRSFGGE